MKSFITYLKENKTSFAPYGVLMHKDKIFIGVNHTVPVKITDPDLLDTIVEHGKKSGYFYEGSGKTKGGDLIQNQFGLKTISDYTGGWDKQYQESIKKIPVSAKDLSLFTGNVPINFDHIGPIMTGDHNIYKGFEKLINHPRFFNGRPVNPSIIKEFLKKAEVKSNNKWLTRAQTEMATSKNCKSFLMDMEEESYPDDWRTNTKKHGLTDMSNQINTERNEFVLDKMGPGVYFAGNGHLRLLTDILDKRNEKYTMHGGESIQ